MHRIINTKFSHHNNIKLTTIIGHFFRKDENKTNFFIIIKQFQIYEVITKSFEFIVSDFMFIEMRVATISTLCSIQQQGEYEQILNENKQKTKSKVMKCM